MQGMPDISLRNQVLGDQLAHELRLQIITGQVKAGTHLVEDALAEAFDVSRGPVRDALRQLELEGLVESRRGKARRGGFLVTGITSEDMAELYSLREAVESLAVRLAIQRGAAADWTSARRAVDGMLAAADAADALSFARFDMNFHTQLYAQSGNRRLASVWEQYRPTFAVLLNVSTAQDRDLHPSAESHVELLDTVLRGDTGSAVAQLSEHLLGSKTRLHNARG